MAEEAMVEVVEATEEVATEEVVEADVEAVAAEEATVDRAGRKFLTGIRSRLVTMRV